MEVGTRTSGDISVKNLTILVWGGMWKLQNFVLGKQLNAVIRV